jgi:hypothetical protein
MSAVSTAPRIEREFSPSEMFSKGEAKAHSADFIIVSIYSRFKERC